MLEIPVNFNQPHFSLETTIFNQTYFLEFELIEKENYWVMHIYNGQQKPLSLGIRLIEKWTLFVKDDVTFIFMNNKLIAYETT